ncbi:TetR/AcrR family transcriptional regulator [Corynebacterium kutscheri]|uniref:TetR/AcrR family transcriptional regulator n=1 Tax=Corynebacterium kutscheri TaxID=35755 RepID=UPI0037C09064
MRADAQENRQEILATARTMIIEKGPHFSMRSLAAAAGVGIATLLRHFPSKTDLIIAIGAENAAILNDLVEKTLENWDDNPQTALYEFCSTLAKFRISAMAVAMGDSDIVTELYPTAQGKEIINSIYTPLKKIVDKAHETNLIDTSIDHIHFHLGLVTVTRPLALFVQELAPDYQDWLLTTYLTGIRPQNKVNAKNKSVC